MTSSRLALPGGLAAVLAAMVLLALLVPRGLAVFPGLAGLLLYAAWPLAGYGRRPPLWRDAFFPVMAVIALAGFSALWSASGPDALERTGKAALVLLPGAVFLSAMRHAPLRDRAWWVLPAILAAGSLLIWFENSFDYPVYRLLRGIPPEDRVRHYELNRSMVVLVMLAIPCLPLLLTRARHGLLLAAAFTGCLLAAFSVTASQSAQIALIAAILTFAAFPVRCKISWVVLIVIIIIPVLLAPWLVTALFSALPHEQIAALKAGGGPANTFLTFVHKANVLPRLEIWDSVGRHILEQPWIGSGIEATRMVPAFDSRQLYQPGTTLLHPHNGVLQIWIEFGVLGAGLAATGLALLVWRISRIEDTLARRTALSLLAALMSVGVVGYGVWQGWWLGLIVFSAGLCAYTARARVRPAAAT